MALAFFFVSIPQNVEAQCVTMSWDSSDQVAFPYANMSRAVAATHERFQYTIRKVVSGLVRVFEFSSAEAPFKMSRLLWESDIFLVCLFVVVVEDMRI
jgi:hypothetical protein